MQTASISIQAMLEAHAPQQFTPPYPPTALAPRTHVTSERTAFMPGRRPQTTTTATHHSASTALFPPLEEVTRPNLKTEEAAYYLNRRPQTLRGWACLENGPVRPKRIAGILAWSTSEIRALAGVPA